MDPSTDTAPPAAPGTDPVNSTADHPASSARQLSTEDRTVLGEIAAVMLHPTLPPQATMRLQLTYGRDQSPPLVEHFNAGEYLGELLGVGAAAILARGWQVGDALNDDDLAEIASAVNDTCTGLLAHDLHLAQDTAPRELDPRFLTRANMLASGQFAAVLRDQAAWALQSAAAYLRTTVDDTQLAPGQWAAAAVDNRRAAGRHGAPLPG
ncbi:hypothetical protein GCM10009839_68940 [Catenulispora yoronensis]|uniref:Uncharacterized protein n=1 Tax=Catenulispora yoronensis TaxID=450799 RepID=A0ABN2V5G4_9ACTN